MLLMFKIVSTASLLQPSAASTFLASSHSKLCAIAGVNSFCDTVKLYSYMKVKLIHVMPFMLSTVRCMVSVPFLTAL